MARGWESKSIEAQQADAEEKTQTPRIKITPEQAATARERENLLLSRKRVLQQLDASSNALHRKSLEAALAELDQKLRQIREV